MGAFCGGRVRRLCDGTQAVRLIDTSLGLVAWPLRLLLPLLMS